MRLYIARHGEAGEYSPDPTTERNRSLTAAGRKGVERVAAWIAAHGEQPRVIIASPFARALETADILGRALGARVSIEDELQPDRDLARWVMDLLDDDSMRRVMLVGHTDNITPMLKALDGSPDDPLAKGEVRRLKVDRGSGEFKERWRVKPEGAAL